jgi:hypothetical protein
MKNTFISTASMLIFLMMLSACQSANQKDIQKQLDVFFGKTVMHNEVDQNALSNELSSLLQQTLEAEKNDAEATKNGPFPTDKPLLIEGDIFSSLYEGRTSVKVQSISIEEQKAKAVLALENKPYNTQWTDTVMLVNENKVWKIDDVVYGQANKQGSTRQVLNKFLAAYRQKVSMPKTSMP